VGDTAVVILHAIITVHISQAVLTVTLVIASKGGREMLPKC